MRTADLARRAGCSVQQVRKLEAVGVLPPVARTTAGYRVYGEEHETSLRAYQALTVAVGPIEARMVMCETHRDERALLARLDAAHAHLHQERRELALAREAVAVIRAEPIPDVRPTDAMSIGQLATALGVRPSTLRHWEAEGLLTPGRGPHDQRTYSPADVRDARLIHQLRQAGYRISPLRELMPRLRDAQTAATPLADREHGIDRRSRALIPATVALAAVWASRPGPGQAPIRHAPEPASDRAALQTSR